MEEGVKLQVNKNQLPKSYVDGYEAKIKAQKELVESLKIQWKLLWSERFNDKIRAEDVSIKDYTSLSVERGTVIHANRDFKSVTFKEILEQNLVENPERFVQPNAQTGGWSKFVRTTVISSNPQKKNIASPTSIKNISTNRKKADVVGFT